MTQGRNQDRATLATHASPIVAEGALIIDKPAGITSHDVVQRVRRALRERRIGHLGTLDPFATGVLVLLVGRATRLAIFYGQREKCYEGAIRLGYSTETYDATGTPSSSEQACDLSEGGLREMLAEFVGTYAQTPPAFSAKKREGRAAYELARRGESVVLSAVPVTVHGLRLLDKEGSLLRFYARVSSGTYIRSLAHEIGKRCGCGAHLAQLRRTAVGEFTIAEAVEIEQFEEEVSKGDMSRIIPALELLPEFQAVRLSQAETEGVLHGRDVVVAASTQQVKLLDSRGRLCAIGERVAERLYHPAIVLAPVSSEEGDSRTEQARRAASL